MTTKANDKYTNFKFRKNDTILFGNESSGVPEKIHKLTNYSKNLMVNFDKKVNSIIVSNYNTPTEYFWRY